MNGEELWNHAIPFTAQGTPMTYLSPQGNQTLIVVVPVFNSTRGSGYLPLPAEEEDLWEAIFLPFAYRKARRDPLSQKAK